MNFKRHCLYVWACGFRLAWGHVDFNQSELERFNDLCQKMFRQKNISDDEIKQAWIDAKNKPLDLWEWKSESARLSDILEKF